MLLVHRAYPFHVRSCGSVFPINSPPLLSLSSKGSNTVRPSKPVLSSTTLVLSDSFIRFSNHLKRFVTIIIHPRWDFVYWITQAWLGSIELAIRYDTGLSDRNSSGIARRSGVHSVVGKRSGIKQSHALIKGNSTLVGLAKAFAVLFDHSLAM